MKQALVKIVKWSFEKEWYCTYEILSVKATGKYGKIIGQPEFEIYNLNGNFLGFTFADCVKLI